MNNTGGVLGGELQPPEVRVLVAEPPISGVWRVGFRCFLKKMNSFLGPLLVIFDRLRGWGFSPLSLSGYIFAPEASSRDRLG